MKKYNVWVGWLFLVCIFVPEFILGTSLDLNAAAVSVETEEASSPDSMDGGEGVVGPSEESTVEVEYVSVEEEYVESEPVEMRGSVIECVSIKQEAPTDIPVGMRNPAGCISAQQEEMICAPIKEKCPELYCKAPCKIYIEPLLSKIDYSGASAFSPGGWLEFSRWQQPTYLPTYAVGMRAGVYLREGLLLQGQFQGYLTYWKQPQNMPVGMQQNISGLSIALGRYMDLSVAYTVPLSEKIHMKPSAGIRHLEAQQEWSFDGDKLQAMQHFKGTGPICGLELQKCLGCWGISTFASIAGGVLSGSWSWALSGMDYRPFSSLRPFVEIGSGAYISSSSCWGVWGLSVQVQRAVYLYTYTTNFVSAGDKVSSNGLSQDKLDADIGDIVRSLNCTLFFGF